jgi:hypothetical protein
MLKLASEHFRLDLQLFWQRGSLFLLLNTAVATVYASVSQAALRPVLAVFGIITTVFWFLVMRASAYWIDNWRRELAALDAIVSNHRFFTRMSEETARRPWLVPSEISKWLPATLAIGWCALFIWSVTLVIVMLDDRRIALLSPSQQRLAASHAWRAGRPRYWANSA